MRGQRWQRHRDADSLSGLLQEEEDLREDMEKADDQEEQRSGDMKRWPSAGTQLVRGWAWTFCLLTLPLVDVGS